MKGYRVYSQIQQLKEKGFKKANVAKQLGINRRTVVRYWNMSADDYKENSDICRIKLLNEYEDSILMWLRAYPTLSAAQVCDWLKEYFSAGFSERTVSRYVKELRQKHNLKKTANPRSYAAVPELPAGKQLQVDFGEKWMVNSEGVRIKVQFAAFVLAHSRYKYVELQSRPFTATDLTRACRNCFRFLGGMPEELVFDQDSIVCVSENCGDIIHTYEFEKLRQECKFRVYLCRAADPESKGKIENVVRYVKGNLLENRIYPGDDETLNCCCMKWLDRTGNAKIHGTTKRVPAEVFEEERKYLRLLPNTAESADTGISRMVRKDNTVIYDSNRYSVPLGTYNKQPEVLIGVSNGILHITTPLGELICEHPVSIGRGMLIQNTSHTRDREPALNAMQAELNKLLLYQADSFLQAIRTEKSRYARDQFHLMQSLCKKYGVEAVLEAVRFCAEGRLYSANYVKDYAEHNTQPQPHPAPIIPVSSNKYHITAEKRPLAVYAKAGGAK